MKDLIGEYYGAEKAGYNAKKATNCNSGVQIS